jgi:hypothetical protein
MKMRVSLIDPLKPDVPPRLQEYLNVNGSQYALMLSQVKYRPLQPNIDMTTAMGIDLNGDEMSVLLSDTTVDPSVSMPLCTAAFLIASEIPHLTLEEGTAMVTPQGCVFVGHISAASETPIEDLILEKCQGYMFDNTHHARMAFSRHFTRLLKAALPGFCNDMADRITPDFIS